MRRKNIPDQEVTTLIKKGRIDVLANLFERNIVTCLNFSTGMTLAIKRVIIHSHFPVHLYGSISQAISGNRSSHKIDFMIDFLNRKQLDLVYGHEVKIPYQFPELEYVFTTYEQEPKAVDTILTNNLNVLSDSHKELLTLTFLKKWISTKSPSTLTRPMNILKVKE